MTNAIDTKAALHHAVLLSLTLGSTTHRYCRWTEDLTISGQTFTACPTLEVNLGEQHAGAKDEPATITTTPLAPFDQGVWYEGVVALIEEVDPTDLATRQVAFYGTVGEITLNAGGHAERHVYRVDGLKANLEVDLGLRCGSSCTLTLGDDACGIGLNALKHNGALTIVDGTTCEVSGLTGTRNLGLGAGTQFYARLYYKGYIKRDGYAIPIIGYNGSTGSAQQDRTIVLAIPPPPTWDGLTVDVFPGCDKQPSTCNGTWKNLSQILVLGRAMPPRNVFAEQG